MKTTVAYIVFCLILLGMYWYYVQFLKKEQIKRTALLEQEVEHSKAVKDSYIKLTDEMIVQTEMISNFISLNQPKVVEHKEYKNLNIVKQKDTVKEVKCKSKSKK